jgi:hypothetical protein
MATLTETAIVTRKAIKFGGVAFVAITIMWFVGGAAWKYYQYLNPPPLPIPTQDFGPLPEISFPKEISRPKMTLELPTGVFPKFADRGKIFVAPTKRSGFLDPDRALETARALGFLFKPDQPTETEYIFSNQDILQSKLVMDTVSGHFKLTRNWQNDPSLLASTSFLSDQQVTNTAATFLRRANLMFDDVSNENKVTYLKAEAGQLVQTISLSEADFVQVDFFRNSLDEIDNDTKKVVSSFGFFRPNPDYGLIRVIVSSSKDINNQVILVDYNYTRVDYLSVGTYPIKSPQFAWQELSTGGGFVTAKYNQQLPVVVRRVMLGYFDSEAVQQYAMPIYIFLGDGGFTAYVSAVDDTSITKKSSGKPSL